jgi:hypothetical protein
VGALLAVPRDFVPFSDTIRKMFEWRTVVGWLVTPVSGLVPTWVHKAAEGLFKTPFGKYFLAAHDLTSQGHDALLHPGTTGAA